MQEDIENRAVALAIKSVKLTGHGLKVAIAKYLAHRKEQKLHTAPTGRQTVKQLMRQGQSVSNIEITDGNASEKVLSLLSTLAVAFSSPAPSFHPFDLCVGIIVAGVFRSIVYVKSKNAKKYRKNEEYGSARWSA